MVGIAREVAALTGGALKLPTVAASTIPRQPELAVQVREPQACPVYSATLIQVSRLRHRRNGCNVACKRREFARLTILSM